MSIAVLHVVAIGLYYLMDIAQTNTARQRMFAWTWMGATVLVIFAGLQRIKRARSKRASGP